MQASSHFAVAEESLVTRPLRIEPGLRTLILVELILPIVLLIFGIYHGLLQTYYRAGIIRSESFLGIGYYQGMTAHGVINAIVFTTFFAVAFGNALIRFFLDRALNLTVAWLSAGLMIVGTLMAAVPIFAGQASVLYTFYPPLRAHPAFYLGAVLLVVGSWVGWFNWIGPYVAWLREHPGRKAPLAVMGIHATFIVWFIATIPVAIEILVLLLPWSLGWVKTVNVPLARMLFWFFGHPLVYFWIMPAYIMYYTMLPRLAGGKLYSDFAGRFTFLWFVIYSIPIGIHHQFTEPGISTTWKYLHAFFTMLVAIPSLTTAFTIAASMEYAGKRKGATGIFDWWYKQPYVDRERWLFSYFFAGLLIFIFGGVTGIVNASYNMNLVIHNTSWLPAHFHQTVAGPTMLAFLGMTLWLVSKLTGREVRFKEWNAWMPYVWFVGIMVFSGGLFVGGVGGEPRRTNMGLTYTNPKSPLYHPNWGFAKVLGALGGTIMTVAMLIWFVVFFATLFGRKTAEDTLDFPVADVYHDENIGAVQTFKPWIIAALVLIVIAYAPPILDIFHNHFAGALPYAPDNPVPVGQ